MGDYAFKNQLCMTASEVGKNCWKTSLQWEISVSAETMSEIKQLVCANHCIALLRLDVKWVSCVDQHGQQWMSVVCAKFVLQLLPDNRRECWNSCKQTV
jgi:putative heme degradation protein